ncbi:protein NYNRIN-like [Rhynchophorus ferrugineus]|uniref:protein NYNRIN-like n=1 Tax=Rhynchophorus ferrugineus TaxID=354439 RepID=UPI003FCE7824
MYCSVKFFKHMIEVRETTFWKKIFDFIHNNAHGSSGAALKSIADKFIWLGMNKQIKHWSRSTLPCQRSKIGRHVRRKSLHIAIPDERFSHVNIDIVGPMPTSHGYRYCLTMIDKLTRWPEATPIKDIPTNTIVDAFFGTLVAKVGTSKKFDALTKMIGSQIIRTTSYHPEGNGLIER